MFPVDMTCLTVILLLRCWLLEMYYIVAGYFMLYMEAVCLLLSGCPVMYLIVACTSVALVEAEMYYIVAGYFLLYMEAVCLLSLGCPVMYLLRCWLLEMYYIVADYFMLYMEAVCLLLLGCPVMYLIVACTSVALVVAEIVACTSMAPIVAVLQRPANCHCSTRIDACIALHWETSYIVSGFCALLVLWPLIWQCDVASILRSYAYSLMEC